VRFGSNTESETISGLHQRDGESRSVFLICLKEVIFKVRTQGGFLLADSSACCIILYGWNSPRWWHAGSLEPESSVQSLVAAKTSKKYSCAIDRDSTKKKQISVLSKYAGALSETAFENGHTLAEMKPLGLS